MLRFLFQRRSVALSSVGLAGMRSLTMSDMAREDLSRAFAKVKEEVKGQTLDLSDMGEAARTSMNTVKDVSQKPSVLENAQLKAKLLTLHASLKAYSARLANLQNEARSIHSDADQILSIVWEGIDTHKSPSETTEKMQEEKPPESTPTVDSHESSGEEAEKEDLGIEVPPVAQRLEEINKYKPSATDSETNEASTTKSDPEPEIEVETVEVQGSVEDMSITDITKELHEKDIDFSDCLDARSLRKRYRDYVEGRVTPKIQQQMQPPPKGAGWTLSGKDATYPSGYSSTASQSQQRPPEQTPYSERAPNTADTAVTPDPYPGAQRKMVDPMKYIYELKAELASENRIPANQIDLWCGGLKLDDNRRLYEYPQANQNRIEIRQKGDVPR